ncbi:MAG: retroviral-like aspartic protease family protein [Planctomycetaceae bacterium]|nr:retroviral-like aspartic protease family protein [Planctomycetaceae bacterium]
MRHLASIAFLIFSPCCIAADEPNSAGESSVVTTQDPALELRVTGSNVVFVGERDLARGISEAATLKRKVKQAATPLRQIQQEINRFEIGMVQGEQQLVNLSAQLANVQSVADNNRLVGAINAIQGQMTLARKNLEVLKEKENQARVQLNAAREAYVQHTIEMRNLASQLEDAYAGANDSGEVQEKLKSLAADSFKELKFEKSSSLLSNLRKLEELEKSVHKEKIPLRRDGNTFYATVVINGKHTTEMVVDSGASLISLPYELAVSMDLKPEPNDKRILLSIADGSTITGVLKKIPLVRVGTFEVKDVECAVLGPEAVSATPLLGMAFLGEFQFQLDSAESTLGITRIDGEVAQKRR